MRRISNGSKMMRVNNRAWCGAAVAAAVLASSQAGSAALVYVDANHTANTTPSTAIGGTTADDNLWSLRTGFASGSTIYESGQGDGEDAPEIVTTIDGLVPNTPYTIYVHFWDGSGTDPDWNVRAGLSSNPGANTAFANPADAADIGATAGVVASSLTYTTPPTTFQEADRTMFAGLVGEGTSNSTGQLAVYIDDLPSTIGVNNRSWYDGVSYEVVPEPGCMALLALGGLLVGRRRRA